MRWLWNCIEGSSASPILNLSKSCEGNASVNEEKGEAQSETPTNQDDARDARDESGTSATDVGHHPAHSPRHHHLLHHPPPADEDHSDVNDEDDDDEDDEKHGNNLLSIHSFISHFIHIKKSKFISLMDSYVIIIIFMLINFIHSRSVR